MELLKAFYLLYFWVYFFFLFYYLFYDLALIKDRGLDRIQAEKKNNPKAIKPIFLFHWLTLPSFLCYTNFAVILLGIFAKSKCLILRASTVNAAHEQFSELGGVCYQALLLQRGHDPSFCRGGIEILTAYLWHTKAGNVLLFLAHI